MAKKKKGYFWFCRMADGRYASSITRPTAACIVASDATGLKQLQAKDVVGLLDGLDLDPGAKPIKVTVVRVT